MRSIILSSLLLLVTGWASAIEMPAPYSSAKPLKDLFTSSALHEQTLRYIQFHYVDDIKSKTIPVNLAYSYKVTDWSVFQSPPLSNLKKLYLASQQFSQGTERVEEFIEDTQRLLANIEIQENTDFQLFFREYDVEEINDRTVIERKITYIGKHCPSEGDFEYKESIRINNQKLPYSVYRGKSPTNSKVNGKCSFKQSFPNSLRSESFHRAIEDGSFRVYEVLGWSGKLNSYGSPTLFSIGTAAFAGEHFLSILSLHEPTITLSTGRGIYL